MLPKLASTLHNAWRFAAEQITATDGTMNTPQTIMAVQLEIGALLAVEDLSCPPLLYLLESVGVAPVAMGLDRLDGYDR